LGSDSEAHQVKVIRPLAAMGLFLALGALYLWDVERVERQVLGEIQRQQVFFHEPSDAVRIEYHAAGAPASERLILERRDAASPWRITAPMELAANQSVVAAYLENLRGARRQAEFTPESLAAVGLDAPRLTVRLTHRKEGEQDATTTLLFGSQPIPHGPVHAKLDGEQVAFTVSEWLFKQSDKKLADLRDRRLVPNFDAAIRSLEVTTARGTTTLERGAGHDAPWSVQLDPPVPADKVLADRLLGSLAQGQFLQIFDAPTTPVAQLELVPPVLSVRSGDQLLFEVGSRVPNREQMYARDALGQLGLVARSTVVDFFRSPIEWGTKRFVWMAPETITRIEASSGNATLDLQREGGTWVVPGMTGVQVRVDRIQSHLEAISTITAARLLKSTVAEDDLRSYGVMEESFRLRVTDAAGDTQGFRFGRTDTTEGMTYVYREQDASLWLMDFSWQSRVFKFRRDFEERRLVPGLADQTDRFEVLVGDTEEKVEFRLEGASWKATLPGQAPVMFPPSYLEAFLKSFEDLERESEMALLGKRKPEARFRLYAPGASTPFAELGLLSKNPQTGVGIFLFDGAVVEVDGESFAEFDDQLARILVAAKKLVDERAKGSGGK
jgi:hypothetical protein